MKRLASAIRFGAAGIQAADDSDSPLRQRHFGSILGDAKMLNNGVEGNANPLSRLRRSARGLLASASASARLEELLDMGLSSNSL